MFHQHDKILMKLQSEALNIPIVHVNGHWKNSIELRSVLSQYKKEGAKFILFGDIRNKKNASRIIELCHSMTMNPCMPLWNATDEELMLEYQKRKVKCVLTSVRPIIKDSLGKVFDIELYKSFKDTGIDALGEKGEFHSTLIGLDIFKFPIRYRNRGMVQTVDKFGEKWETLTDYFR